MKGSIDESWGRVGGSGHSGFGILLVNRERCALCGLGGRPACKPRTMDMRVCNRHQAGRTDLIIRFIKASKRIGAEKSLKSRKIVFSIRNLGYL